VVLGGTFQENEKDLNPDSKISERIIQNCKEICPELITYGYEILHHAVGLRPGRVGGIRLESERRIFNGRRLLLVHHYGHCGSGYQVKIV